MEENKYSRGKIYKIEPFNGDDGDIYIGSTTKKYLSSRLAGHISLYKCYKKSKFVSKVSSIYLFEKYGFENCQIYLIENYPCESKNELHTREGYYIKTMNCINKRVAGRKIKEYKQDTQCDAKYYIEHREAIIEQVRKYSSENKDKIRERKKKYRLKNAEKIKEHKSKIETCECGVSFTHSHKQRHLRSAKHKNLINKNNI